MEIILGLAALAAVGYFVYKKFTTTADVPEASETFAAPYKIESPEPVVKPQVTDAVTQEAPAKVKLRQPGQPKQATKKPAAKKPATKKSTASKPRGRKPKAQ